VHGVTPSYSSQNQSTEGQDLPAADSKSPKNETSAIRHPGSPLVVDRFRVLVQIPRSSDVRSLVGTLSPAIEGILPMNESWTSWKHCERDSAEPERNHKPTMVEWQCHQTKAPAEST
jgi:hypothetical protein